MDVAPVSAVNCESLPEVLLGYDAVKQARKLIIKS